MACRINGPRSALLALAAAVLTLTGCKVGPDYVPPEPNVPDAWSQQVTAGVVEGEADIHTWWEALNDPVLDDLIARAATGNLDLEIALGRLKESRALRGVATGEYFPAVDGFGDIRRESTSADFPGGKQTETFYGVGLDATWEIDVWGRIARSVESADAGFQASIEDYRDVLVLVFGEVALNYVDLRALQTRIDYAEENIRLQEGSLQLTRDRRRAEIAPELDVAQAELNLARTEAALPRLRQLRTEAINRIGVLIGEAPGSLYTELMDPAPIPDPPAELTIGLPIDLIRQRPDIRRAERELAAQTALIGVATAELYPRFSISGSFAFDGTSQILDASKQAWFISPAFRWRLFDGGRIRNSILAEEARTEQSLSFYHQTVLLALEEVENALVAYEEERIRRDALARSVDAASRSVELVQTLYRTGLTDFQNVLDMERSLFEQQDDLAASEGLVTQNLVALYRALGGGWDPDPPALAEEVTDADENGEPIF